MKPAGQRLPRRDAVGDGDGGRPARRAMVRWAWRLFRREWREQVLVLALLTLAVAASVCGAAAAYNLAPAAGNAEFGSASHSISFDEPDPRAIESVVDSAEQQFGTIDVIQRRFVTLPGLFDPVELREQSPDGPYSAPMLALLAGRYPSAAGEVAVTDAAAETLQVDVGTTFALDDSTWSVVGTVENPSYFDDDFVLLAPTMDRQADSVTILVEGDHAQVNSFQGPDGLSTTIAGRAGNENLAAAGGVLAASTVLLMLVALIAGAGFVVLAQRRLRQLGLLAAIGATERHLRVVVLANGAVVGAVAAVVGIAIALATWIAMVATLETVVRHRIETFDVPWWLIGTGLVLAVVTATGAAWLPAKAIARTPVVSALSGRPPKPQSKQRSAVVAALLLATGIVCVALGSDPFQSWINSVLLVVGTAALILGILFASPLAIQALALLRGRFSVAVRLALGDLNRYRSRSGAALAAISLVLAIAAAIVISSSAALFASAAEGNLSSQQLLIRIGEIPDAGDVGPLPERTPGEVERLDERVQEIATLLDPAAVIPLDVAVGPAMEGLAGVPAIVLTEEVDVADGSAHRILSYLYVAGDEMLEHYGVALEALPPRTEILTTETGELWYQPIEPELVRNAMPLTLAYSSLPGSFITPGALQRRDWSASRAAWLVETTSAVTEEQFASARALAASAGMTIEIRHNQANLEALRTGATAAGVLVALGVMAMTIGLIRSETAADLRILSAAGATSRHRRTLTAATAGGLALLGAVLGTGGAYLGFGAVYLNDLDALSPIPIQHLLGIAIGLPLVAAVGGWLLGGRESRGRLSE